MKPQSGAQRDRRDVSSRSADSSHSAAVRPAQPLSDDEMRVVACLESAPGGLTLRQLEVKMRGATVDTADVLLEVKKAATEVYQDAKEKAPGYVQKAKDAVGDTFGSKQ